MKKTNGLVVHKFGGTSLRDEARFRKVSELIVNESNIVVVSAIANTTSTLQQLLDDAVSNNEYQNALIELIDNHKKMANALLDNYKDYHAVLEKDLKEVKAILHAVHLIGSYTLPIKEFVLSYGEQWSAQLLASFLPKKTLYLDASTVLVAEKKDAISLIDWSKSEAKLKQFLNDNDYDHLIITGFLAQNREGQRTTLGLNGSDYSAAIFAKLFNANKLVIWTDVDGIYSASPTIVKSAHVLDSLSYKEALELAYFGASVIHPQAMQPALECNIPIYIKNSFNLEAKGTCISAEPAPSKQEIRGLTSICDVVLLNIEGTGMIGVSGMASRVFGALRDVHVSVLLISQASSEHSICMAVYAHHATLALETLKEQFHFELSSQLIEKISLIKDCAILVAVGDAMVGKIGIAGKLLSNLANANINVYAISQGSSERNISVVINQKDINKGLRVTHSGFYLSNKTLSIGLIGPGNVGRALLTQLAENQKRLKDELQINLQLRGIARSKTMCLANDGINASHWQDDYETDNQPFELEEFIAHISAEDRPHSLIIDCTASDDIARHYPRFIESGLHIITPNKKASSGDLNAYHEIKRLSHIKRRHFLYETNVCAGLPVINTLQDLVLTGDEIESIEGVFSGTLSYIFSEVNTGESFSSVIQRAYDLGLTEPDPRDDLSGMDVARKCVCLARELGLEIGLEDVIVESLCPSVLMDKPIDEFLNEKAILDDLLSEKLTSAINANRKLVYLGSISKNGDINVGIKMVDLRSPFYNLEGTDNMVIFTSKRYKDNPLVVQGPGAGAEVTAAGVFADLLRLTSLISGAS